MWSEDIIACPSTDCMYRYWVKHHDEGSLFGIEGGKISKLTIRKNNENRDLCNYDRGWDVEPENEVITIYSIILHKYN